MALICANQYYGLKMRFFKKHLCLQASSYCILQYPHFATQPYYIRSQLLSMLALPTGESLGITADTNTNSQRCKEEACPDENKKVNSLMQFIQNPEEQFLSKSKFSQYNDVSKLKTKIGIVLLFMIRIL